MTHPRIHRGALAPPLARLYRITSALWLVYALGLVGVAHGSTLLRFAEPGRYLLAVLGLLVVVAMLLRVLAPGRPEWTRWTLPMIVGLSVTTFALSLFGAETLGGFTTGRVGLSLLMLTPSGFAYVHYLGEKVVAPR